MIVSEEVYSGNMATSGGLRVGVAKTMITSLEFSRIKQQNDVVNKMTLSANLRY